MCKKTLPLKFFARNTVTVAKELLGKYLRVNNKLYQITETEAYCGSRDKACHGAWRRKQTCQTLWGKPGYFYVYLVYGKHYMLNIVTEKNNYPAAVLIRSVKEACGPGRVAKLLGVDKSWDGKRAVVIDKNERVKFIATPRIGVEYAGKWAKKPWRFVIQ